MKIDLATILKQLGWPLALIALLSAILGLFGVDLDTVTKIAEGLAGTFSLIALLINVLKWAGVLNDGMAGKVSAALNLVVLITVSIVFKIYPSFDFGSVDVAIGEFAKVAAIVFAYIIQLVGSKRVHLAMTRGLWLPEFSYSIRPNVSRPHIREVA